MQRDVQNAFRLPEIHELQAGVEETEAGPKCLGSESVDIAAWTTEV